MCVFFFWGGRGQKGKKTSVVIKRCSICQAVTVRNGVCVWRTQSLLENSCQKCEPFRLVKDNDGIT